MKRRVQHDRRRLVVDEVPTPTPETGKQRPAITPLQAGGTSIMFPRDGDVLVSKCTATNEHEISVIPKSLPLSVATHDLAMDKACELAAERRVDAWLTEDHIHFLKLAAHRDA